MVITIGSILDVFKRNRTIGKEATELWDLDFFGISAEQRMYLKNSAIETNVNLIGRTISLAEFRFTKDKKRQDNDFDYLLNVRPNTAQSAADFWQDFVYTLLVENEVLVILSDSNDLLIADNFIRNEYAVYEDTFEDVTVKDYTFKRRFKMSEVIYITYNNEKFTKFLNGMFTDYTELFSRMIETRMYDSQIRALAEVEANQSLDGETQTKLNNFMNRMYSAFKNHAFAIVPKTKGFNYSEITANQNRVSKSVDELDKLKRDLTGNVANVLGIPASLVHGDMAEYETAIKAFIRFCIKPLVKKINDELSAKLIPKEDYKKGLRLKINGVSELSPVELAAAVDKLVASGSWSRNDIREMFGDERVDDPEMDKYVLTKNYQTIDKSKGGEDE